MVMRVRIENKLLDPAYFAKVIRKGAKDAMDMMSERLQASVVNDTLQSGSPVGFDKITDRGFLAKSVKPIKAFYAGDVLTGGVVSSAKHAAVIEEGGGPWKKKPPFTPIREWIKRRLSISYPDIKQGPQPPSGSGGRRVKTKLSKSERARRDAVGKIYGGMAKRLMKTGMKPRYYMRRAWQKYGPMLLDNFNTSVAQFIAEAKRRRGSVQ